MSRSAVIVAHGQPSDPSPAEADLEAVAAKVAKHLPEWQIRSATLANPGALVSALEGLRAPKIFPFFMADGWFIRTMLPRRLMEANAESPSILQPFGLVEPTRELASRMIKDAAAKQGWTENKLTILLAAHGSGRSRFPAEAALMTETAVAASMPKAEIRTGFIEESPYLADIARNSGQHAVCLPLFVARWGHVVKDIPDALKSAGYTGVVLDPIGTHPDTPGIIAGEIASS